MRTQESDYDNTYDLEHGTRITECSDSERFHEELSVKRGTYPKYTPKEGVRTWGDG